AFGAPASDAKPPAESVVKTPFGAPASDAKLPAGSVFKSAFGAPASDAKPQAEPVFKSAFGASTSGDSRILGGSSFSSGLGIGSSGVFDGASAAVSNNHVPSVIGCGMPNALSAFVVPMIPSEYDVDASGVSVSECFKEVVTRFKYPIIPSTGEEMQSFIKTFAKDVECANEIVVSNNGTFDVNNISVRAREFEQMLAVFREELLEEIGCQLEKLRLALLQTSRDTHVVLPAASGDPIPPVGRERSASVCYSQALRAHLSNAFRKYY
ncbi:hypothetical protein TraAM80_10208, partial [Trypanosoma rangeli]